MAQVKKSKKPEKSEKPVKAEKKQKEEIKVKVSSKTAKIFGELFGLAIGLFIIIKIIPLLPFVTDMYRVWLPIGIWTTIVGSVLKIFKHAGELNITKRLFEIANILVSLYSTLMLIKIFPFDFNRIGYGSVNDVFRFALNIAILAMMIGLAVNFLRILIPEKHKS